MDVREKDWNEFVNLDFEGTSSEPFKNIGHETVITLSNDIRVHDHFTPLNQPCIVEFGESSTGSTPSSFKNLQFLIQNNVYTVNNEENEHGSFQRWRGRGIFTYNKHMYILRTYLQLTYNSDMFKTTKFLKLRNK